MSHKAIQLSVLLVRSQQEVHMYITAILEPYKMVARMWKLSTFWYSIQGYARRGRGL